MKQSSQDDVSLITREQSFSIRGVLIILMILGHNTILMSIDPSVLEKKNVIYYILNSFHTYCFLLLPFLYGGKKLSGRSILDYLAKCYVPYTFFFVICLCISLVLGYVDFNATRVLDAFYIGSFNKLKAATGFQFVWFLGAAFATNILRDCYYSINSKYRIPVFILLWVYLYVFVLGYVPNDPKFIPFGVYVGLIMLPLGICIRDVIEKHGLHNKWVTAVSSVLAIACCVVSYLDVYIAKVPDYIFILFMRIISPVSFLMLFAAIGKALSKSAFLRKVGGLSLPIYLTHVIIYNILLVCCNRFIGPNNVWIGILLFVLTFVVSYFISLLLTSIPVIDRIMFPKSFFRRKSR